VKISVSLPADVVAFLDEYAARTGAGSRASVIYQAVGLLRMLELDDSYAEAWQDWDDSEDARLWRAVVASVAASQSNPRSRRSLAT
jgi:hypothetical protein